MIISSFQQQVKNYYPYFRDRKLRLAEMIYWTGYIGLRPELDFFTLFTKTSPLTMDVACSQISLKRSRDR